MPPLSPFSKSCIALAVSQLLALPSLSHAATITVDSNADNNGAGCTLREAIVSANTSVNQSNGCAIGSNAGTDTITFAPALADSTITLNGTQLDIDTGSDIYIEGSGVTIDANFQSRLLNVTNATISIDSMTLTRGGVEGGETSSINAIQVEDSSLTLSNTIVTNNLGAYESAMLNTSRSDVSINNSSISNNNTGAYGVVIQSNASTKFTINQSTLNDNQANYSLAYVTDIDQVSISNSTISGNSTGDTFISLRRNDSISIVNSTISDNQTSFVILDLIENSMTMTNSTISGNTGPGPSSFPSYGIRLINNELDLINTTINNDSFPNTFRLSNSSNSNLTTSLTFSNSIVAGSSSNNCDTQGNSVSLNDITSDSNSIIQGGGCGTQARDVDPQLAPLADNGGPTLTHSLLSGSPAINTGNNTTCETTDQRGETRPLSAGDQCDVGAFEVINDETTTFVIPLANGKSVIFDL